MRFPPLHSLEVRPCSVTKPLLSPLPQSSVFAPFRNFSLRLKKDAGGFADDFEVNVKETTGVADLSHIYSGQLEGKGPPGMHLLEPPLPPPPAPLCNSGILNGFLCFPQTTRVPHVMAPFSRANLRGTSRQPMAHTLSNPCTDIPPASQTTTLSSTVKTTLVSVGVNALSTQQDLMNLAPRSLAKVLAS